MATFYYVKSGAGAVPLANQAWVNGNKMVPTTGDASANAAIAKRWVWEVTTAGTSTGVPTWSASVTQDVTTVTQNGVVWTARKPGFSSGTTANWTYATIYLEYAFLAATTSGDTIYVSNNHAESTTLAGAGALATNVQVLCGNDAAAPPTTPTTTATVTTTGNTSIGLNNAGNAGVYIYGITFISGSGASGLASVVAPVCKLESCGLTIATTGSTSVARVDQGDIDNCTFKFGAVGQGISGNALVTPTSITCGALASGGSSPTTLFKSVGVRFEVNGFDLTNASAGINLTADTQNGVQFNARNFRLPGSWSGSVNSSTPSSIGNTFYQLMNADSSGTNYVLNRKMAFGSVVQETSIFRAGGASNGTTSLSWKFVTGTTPFFPSLFLSSPEIVKWFPITGFAVASPVTVTLHFIRDNATAMNDDEIWAEAVYLGTSGAPLGTLITNAKANLANAAAQPSDSSTSWTGTGGFSNPNKQKLVLTFTPNLAGIIHIVVKVCKASVTALYLDPQVDFS